MKSKVFGIGFHKTGTTSLAVALRHLGYSVTGPNGVDDPDIAKNVYQMAFELVEQYDAFQDNPWPILYKELDQKFPGSKFILTLRPTDAWLRSIVGHFGETDTPMRQWIYGVGHPKGNEAIYQARYERHNEEVQEYFSDRPQDLLIFRLTESGGWPELCAFLGEPQPDADFPHMKNAAERNKKPGFAQRLKAKLGLR